MLTRRHFIATSTALFSTPIANLANAAPTSNRSQWDAWDAQITPAAYDPATSNPWGLHRRFLPQRVEANAGLTPGDIHVDAVARYLYHIEEGGTAMRYGVAIARGKLYEPGTFTIKRKSKWPTWTPTPAMIKRDPHLY
ncbi:MAG: L,D-transpeptidase, partial [Planktotalea sp.]|uniref:L,D-transpeptidase n=1 Tax=Planktotalea sp. TaxID=2029877 RepID=UPI003C74FAF6